MLHICLISSYSDVMLLLYLCRYMVNPQEDTRLVSLSLQQFVKSVGARTPAPGGGSVSAAVAALVRIHVCFTECRISPNICVITSLCCRGRHLAPWWVKWRTGRGSLRTWTVWWGGWFLRFIRRWTSCCSWWTPTRLPSTATWWGGRSKTCPQLVYGFISLPDVSQFNTTC